MGQLTTAVPPQGREKRRSRRRRAKICTTPNLSSWHLYDKMLCVWGGGGGRWAGDPSDTFGGPLMSHPPPRPCLSLPQGSAGSRKCNTSRRGGRPRPRPGRQKTLSSNMWGCKWGEEGYFWSRALMLTVLSGAVGHARPRRGRLPGRRALNLTSPLTEAFLVSITPSIFVFVHIPPVFLTSPRRQ